MTERLDTVIEKLRQLPESDQHVLAAHLDEAIDPMQSDLKWKHLLTNSPNTLAQLADEERAAEEAAETKYINNIPYTHHKTNNSITTFCILALQPHSL